MKFHNLCTCVLKIFLFDLFFGSFQFVPQSRVVPPAFFSVDILPFPSFIHFTDNFLCNSWFSRSLLNFTTHGRIPLDDGSARRRDLYLTKRNTHIR